MKKRTLRECEELIQKLQKNTWEKDKIIREMRMALYYVNKYLSEIEAELDGMWCHGLDGSDLIISKDELWEVVQCKLIRNLLHLKRDIVNKPLLKLKQFIGW